MGSGSLGHILLGTGLGILAVSGLIVTVLFGQYHNKAFDKLYLYESKVEWPNYNGIRSCCVAIAVLGCIAAVAAIAAIALSILLEGQTMVLIIVGAVSALFAFACIIAEGIYTKKVIDYEKASSRSEYEHDHEKAQKYIKGAIKDLLQYGKERLENEYPKKEGEDGWKLLDTDSVVNQLGKTYYKDRPKDSDIIFTYQNFLWCPDGLYDCRDYHRIDDPIFTDDFVVLYKRNDIIYATSHLQIQDNYDNRKEVPIANYKFKPEDKKFVPKQKVCWPTNKNMTTYEDIECKMIKLKEINYNQSRCTSPMFDKEYIVVGTYYSEQDADDRDITVNYEVTDFPVMYAKISKEEYDNEKYDGYHTDSDNSFDGMSGKKYAELNQEDDIDRYKKGSEYTVFLTLNKVTDFTSLKSECKRYYGMCSSINNKDGCQERICRGEYGWNNYYTPTDFEKKIDDLLATGGFQNIGYSLRDIVSPIQERYPDKNKGKIAPAYKKYLEKDEDKDVKELPKSALFYKYLYTVALIHLIVQIFGIILWAVGRFVGLALGGGSDAKTQSEGEA